MKWKIIKTEEQFGEAVGRWSEVVAVDIETYQKEWWREEARILGVGLATESEALYVVGFPEYLKQWIGEHKLVGHNLFFDSGWLKHFGAICNLHHDTMLAWHMLDNSINRSHSLGNAQKEWLKKTTHKDGFAQHVKEKGGDVKKGDHWMADLEVLAEYCCADAFDTYQIYLKQKEPLNGYEWFLHEHLFPMMEIFQEQYQSGIYIDVEGLNKYKEVLNANLEKCHREFVGSCGNAIAEIEQEMYEEIFKGFKSERGRSSFKSSLERHPRFNIQSKQQLGRLLHEKLRLPVYDRTEKEKRPKVALDTLERLEKKTKIVTPLIEYSHDLKILGYVDAYIKYTDSKGILHPSINMVATVSGRVAGFEPNILQIPMNRPELLKCFKPKEGWALVGGDFASMEKMWTAHYTSQVIGEENDELLKILRNGYDPYMELVGEVFGEEKAQLYDRLDIEGSKERLKAERDKLKTAGLALDYGASEWGVCRGLKLPDTPYNLNFCRRIVNAFHKKFWGVKELKKVLEKLYQEQGFLENAFGRRLYMEKGKMKDIVNRMIQSSAHDCLVRYNILINNKIKESNFKILPWIVDFHDALYWQVLKEEAKKAVELMKKCLEDLNEELKLAINLKMDIKIFDTFEEAK